MLLHKEDVVRHKCYGCKSIKTVVFKGVFCERFVTFKKLVLA